MSTGISENVSKKEKRGRPRIVDSKLEEIYRNDVGSYTSRRTVHNVHYRVRAMSVLGLFDKPFPEAFRWLCDSSKQGIKGQSDRQGYRSTIMAELGRFSDDEVLRAYAGVICELKPKTQDAVRFLRCWRLGD
jgi:hypothetical protein